MWGLELYFNSQVTNFALQVGRLNQGDAQETVLACYTTECTERSHRLRATSHNCFLECNSPNQTLEDLHSEYRPPILPQESCKAQGNYFVGSIHYDWSGHSEISTEMSQRIGTKDKLKECRRLLTNVVAQGLALLICSNGANELESNQGILKLQAHNALL